ncbi:MAG: YggS family pyridoxal phosphate-dependent enzyme [Cytophagales bacterium]|nr:YggS family pyridoxal phosphate-dependent enzyme [Cytophagales bacterium]
MSIQENLHAFKQAVCKTSVRLVAVSKTKPVEMLQEAYDAGQRLFGENKVQELAAKHEQLPKDIEWHMIGHLQRNKVKYIAPFVSLIHAVDSLSLLKEINKRAAQNGRIIPVLLQMHIADEESKFGLTAQELRELLQSDVFRSFDNIQVKGLMGMATNTSDKEKVRREFAGLKSLFEELKKEFSATNIDLKELSMGMSGDYEIAVEEGATLIRVGSAIFGARNYNI